MVYCTSENTLETYWGHIVVPGGDTVAALLDHSPPKQHHDAPPPSPQASPLSQAGVDKNDYKD